MADPAPFDGRAHPGLFHLTEVTDPAELDRRSRVSDRLPGSSREFRYRLLDRMLWRTAHAEAAPILSLAIRRAGPIVVSHGENRFATEVTLEGAESDMFALSTPSRGSFTLVRRGEAATVRAGQGLVCRFGPEDRLVLDDDSARANLFVKPREVEEALERALDRQLRAPLAFAPVVDWHDGLAASLKAQLDFLDREFARPDGIAGNPAALAFATDLLVSLMLHGLPHNHTADLELVQKGVAAPAYVRRAEEFMRAHCAEPLRMADIAAAAGCSVRTLSAVFQQFRGRTPLAALHAARLEQAHAELSRGDDGAPIGAVARRYGFTNPSRFAAAFRRRFGDTPLEVRRRFRGGG